MIRVGMIGALLLVGCAASTPSSGTGTTTPPAQQHAQAENLPAMPEGLQGPAKPWAQMSLEERGHYMAENIMPPMTRLFQGFDGTKYAQVTCATCHGARSCISPI